MGGHVFSYNKLTHNHERPPLMLSFEVILICQVLIWNHGNQTLIIESEARSIA